jgi:hypothetical protein
MLLQALRNEERWDSDDVAKAQIKASLPQNLQKNVYLRDVKAAPGNEQILFSSSDDKVTLTVKSKRACWKWGASEPVGDVYLVSEFTYTKVGDSDSHSVTKSFRSGVEYI